MIQMQVIGNLGKDAEVRKINDRDYFSFSVASTKRRGDEKVTTWVNVLKPYSDRLRQYLVKGEKVFVSGGADIKPFVTKDGKVGVDVSVFADVLQLVGVLAQNNDAQATETEQVGNIPTPPISTPQAQNIDETNAADDLPFD